MIKLYPSDIEDIRMRLGWRDLPPDGFAIKDVVPLLWCGWECDTHLVLIEYHGNPEFIPVLLNGTQAADTVKQAKALLISRIAAYREAIIQSEAALRILENEE